VHGTAQALRTALEQAKHVRPDVPVPVPLLAEFHSLAAASRDLRRDAEEFRSRR